MKFFNLLAIVALTSAIKLERNEAPAVQELSQTSLDVTEGGVGGKKKKNKGKGKGKGKKLRGNGVEEADATSEDAFANIYNQYDQLAQDFRKCKIFGEALVESAPSQICAEEKE